MDADAAQTRIAFLGIGLMGKPMAGRLLNAGYPLHAWNRTRQKAEALLPLGAAVDDRIEDAVANADIVVTMLEAGPAVAGVLNTAMKAMRKGTLVVDMSSTRQSEAQAFDDMLRNAGLGFIDAPVSGGVIGAEAGTLAIMAGGRREDFERARDVLSVLGRPTLVGPAGCGQLAKLCNQLIVGGTLSIVAEALLLAQVGGADPVAVRTALRGGFAESRILEVHGQRMLDRNFLPGGQVKSQAKDLDNALAAAAAGGIRLPVTELVTQLYRDMLGELSTADQSAVLLALERMNPAARLGDGQDKLPD
ncbi:dehydrogenase [Noviherbaspirillum aridicola]|uniref:Dehydrogenase n=2 Tax=Noviherbaspirillum aridicola TaxID=2849687 RepID=A0ABQ4Q6M6_9BURK|nr:dehydrogenase [Noviherbaspirillum aridicola]